MESSSSFPQVGQANMPLALDYCSKFVSEDEKEENYCATYGIAGCRGRTF